MTTAFIERPGTDAAYYDTLTGARALVFGLGRFGGGVAVTRWLVNHGAQVAVTDLASAESLCASLDQLSDCPLSWRLGRHDPADLDDTDFVVVNPAVEKRRSTFFAEILRREIPWTTETNLFCRRCRGLVVGVTGSFGKSTTCAMIAATLEQWLANSSAPYSQVFLGGNIGHSLLNQLDQISANDIVVLELSNSQLEDLPRIGWSPPLAVITNIRPHHLDRYDNFEAYAEAKLNIARDPHCASDLIYGDLPEGVISRLREVLCGSGERCQPVASVDPPLDLLIPGRHNQHNAAVAYSVCRRLGVSDEVIRDSLASFVGLPHRLELIRTMDGVAFFNDSKCTSLRAMVASVEAMKRPCVLIAGGSATGDSLDRPSWAALLRKCRSVVCTGDTAGPWLATLRECLPTATPEFGSGCRIALENATDLGAAVGMARAAARTGDVVLFAPGAPSFDRYANFADRGDHFRAIVGDLVGKRPDTSRKRDTV